MKVLLLAGTAEARALAQALAQDPLVALTASLAGETAAPPPLGVETRVGGFGGEIPQKKYMQEKGFHAVLDATHPFAETIGPRTASICARLGLPYLRLLRPGWAAQAGDDWHRVATPEEVAALIPPGASVFLSTGRKTLDQFSSLAAGDRKLWVRVVDLPAVAFPWEGGWITGRPGATVEDEIALLRELDIDWLVTKDSGGPARAKLDAARELGLPVVMIDRAPPPPLAELVDSVEAALGWVHRLRETSGG